MIQDSGERRQFETGAVRDIEEGKGRMDLMPLDIIGEYVFYPYIENNRELNVLEFVDMYVERNYTIYLVAILDEFCNERGWDRETMLIEVSKHMAEGASKYGERNWQKGIPCHCYVDSACRHYLKWKRGDDDERHDRAFCWNIICLAWTRKHKPELDDL